MHKDLTEYLDSIHGIEETHNPYSEEIIWADYMIALASNPKLVEQSVEEDSAVADSFMQEFKKRFRD